MPGGLKTAPGGKTYSPINPRNPSHLRQRLMLKYPPPLGGGVPPQLRLFAMSQHEEESVRVNFIFNP
jgi:hypothetical protein